MKTTKAQFAVLCAMLCSLIVSQPLSAEESYERFAVRSWTYRDGTEATGKLITVTGPTATLSLDGQGTVRVPLEKLSVKDLNWIYEYHKRKKLLSFLPPEYRKPQTEVGTKDEPDTAPAAKPAPAQPASEPSPTKSAADSMPAETEKNVADKESYKPFTLREFVLKDGTRYSAKLLSVSPQGKVTLLKDGGGGAIQVALDDLIEKDVEWIIRYHSHNNLVSLLPEDLKAKATELGAKAEPADVPAKMEAGSEMKDATGLAKADEDADIEKADTEIDPKLVAALNDYRIWTDKQGQKSEVKFTRVNGREVVFVGKLTGFINVHIGKLIPEDLQLLRDALKMHGRFDEIPLAYREDPDPNLSPIRLKQFMQLNFQRKWTDLSGNSVAASYVKMEEGNVTLLITKTGVFQEFPYQNFSAEDQIYVQERLGKEIPGNFFPEVTEVTLTPEEREKGFYVFTDLNQRKLKGKFVRLAYGESVTVLNTGKKEELFITEFFSDSDLSLIKPRKQKQNDQLAMNGAGSPHRDAFSNQSPNMDMGMSSESMFPKQTFICQLCNKTHQSESLFFQQCPHCGLKDTDSLYTCTNCSRTFKTDYFQGTTAPCPHCNKNTNNNPIARNPNPFPVEGGNQEKMYTCEHCNLRFTAKGHGDKAPCPKCNNTFNAKTNFWTAIVRLGIAVVILLGGGGSYYKYSNR